MHSPCLAQFSQHGFLLKQSTNGRLVVVVVVGVGAVTAATRRTGAGVCGGGVGGRNGYKKGLEKMPKYDFKSTGGVGPGTHRPNMH